MTSIRGKFASRVLQQSEYQKHKGPAIEYSISRHGYTLVLARSGRSARPTLAPCPYRGCTQMQGDDDRDENSVNCVSLRHYGYQTELCHVHCYRLKLQPCYSAALKPL